MASVILKEQVQDQPSFISTGEDKDTILASLQHVLNVEVGLYLTEDQNKNLSEAFDLYFNLPAILKTSNAEKTIEEKLESIGKENVVALAKLRNLQSLLPVVAAIWAHRNRPDDAEHNAYNIETIVALAAKSKQSYEDLMISLEDTAIWKSITPHPTETLNEEGVRYFRELISAGELPEHERKEAVREILKKMLRANITPHKKNNTFEETDQAIEQARIYRRGQRKYFSRLKAAVEENYSAVDTSDLADRMPDVVLHLWQGGADTDGKLNAERWARLYGMTSITCASLQDHLDDLVEAENILKNGTLSDEFSALSGKFDTLKNALKQAHDRFKEFQDSFVEIAPDGTKSLKKGIDYATVKKKFEELNTSLSIGEGDNKVVFNNSDDFSKEISKRFGTLKSSTQNPQARDILEQSKYILDHYGLAIAKLETRHNGKIYEQMFDNLFADKKFRKKIGDLCPRGLKNGKKFSELKMSVEARAQLLESIKRRITPDQIKAALYRANPLQYEEGTGLPLQNHEFLELFELAAIAPQKFGELALISEADGGLSSIYQDFAMGAFGLHQFIQTPLNEDYDSARKIPENMAQYHEGPGKQSMITRGFNANSRVISHKISQAVMIFCSDAIKDYGRLVTYLQAEGIKKTTAEGISKGIAVLFKIGNGFAIERCGGDPMMFGRYIAEVVRDYAEKRYNQGNPLNPRKNPEDRAILRMVSFFSHTEQGRATRFYMPTANRVEEEMSNQTGEMLGRRLEVQGFLQKEYIIPPQDNMPENMRTRLHEYAHRTMQFFNNVRHAEVIPDQGSLTNSWAEKILGPIDKIMPFANNSARAASKDSGGKAKGIDKERAIGNQRKKIMLRTHHDGWFGNGFFMRMLHDDYRQGNIDDESVKSFAIDSSWWRRQFFSRGMAASCRSNMAHGFEKLGVAKEWTFDRCMEIGSACKVEKDKKGNVIFSYEVPDHFDGEGVIPQHVTPEEAYHAMLVYDQACFSALTEASLNFLKQQDLSGRDSPGGNNFGSPFKLPMHELLKTVRPADNSVNVLIGHKTKKRMEWIRDIEDREHNALADKKIVEHMGKHADQFTEAEKRLGAASVFSKTHPSERIASGRTEYGYPQNPEPWDAIAPKPFWKKIWGTKKPVANDNSYAAHLVPAAG